jgi:iron(II)-dependent oxidoreductase
VGGREPVRPDIDELYDAFRHARSARPGLPLLRPGEARAYAATVRDKVFDLLDSVPLAGRPLVTGGFAFGMIVQHEQQHDETMLATLQLRVGSPVLSAPPPPTASTLPATAEVLIPAGPFTMGTSTDPWALDNERPAHVVDVPAFVIDSAPVTNARFATFIADGGYDQPRWWSAEGWQHRVEADLSAPMHWRRDGDGWAYTRFGRTDALVPDEPVVHVCFHEARAYASWAGKRLPTEAEWEKAARFDPATGRSRRYPWGDAEPDARLANLGQRHLAPAPVGAYPAGASPLGVHQLIGDVWEWVDSDFSAYPGFTAFPYQEYSEVFFGPAYKMLRGGSFGTDAAACRGTFRNWDLPIRRQIFSGFRCARDPLPAEAP